jgi:D-serine deaminase-like pyridoxal phosphate-dependent protein
MIKVRPSDRGAPHAPYFASLNEELRRSGPGKPVLLLDLDALDANIDAVRRAAQVPVRVVAKSLPSLPLLRYVLERLGTDRLMVFDDSVELLAAELPGTDLLLGKPLPVRAAEAFYAALRARGAAGSRVRWLIDSAERLAQYAALGRALGVKLRVSIEVDIGLRRGGVPTPSALAPLLSAISADPAHLSFAGLMGYDAHAMSAPRPLSTPEKAFAATVARYAAFKEAVHTHDASWLSGDAIYNGGGSKTYALHRAGGPVDEVALGSVLVKPTSFDVPTLQAHVPAIYIATPVLKRLEGTRVPFIEWASAAWAMWDPNREVTYFIFGGGWLARPVSPAGLTDNSLYGFSTNQAMLNGSRKTALSPDDHVFLRPTQSERVMQEFGSIRLVRGGRLHGQWSPIPFAA